MRLFSFLFLLVFAGVVAIFAWQNRQEVTLNFIQWSLTADMAVILGGAFVLGMLSGWSILGMLRRSVGRTAELFNRQPAPART
jgi:lipopolysaccharide assembly protein A